ncbi:MAG: glycosyltransferase [Caldilineaceae bacterium]
MTWRIQQQLGIPYLSVFTNLRLFDACLRVLPGHDLVYERNSLYRIGVAMACQWLKLPYVLFVEADEILEHDIMGKPIVGLKRWGTAKMFQYNLRAADCVICVSEQSKRHLVTQWRVPEQKAVVFPNGVDIARFRPYPELRQRIRTKLDIGDGPLLLFVGNFYKWHDVATLLDAFAILLQSRPDVRLALVGDGEQRPAMVERATQLGIAHAVRFTGFVDHAEIPQYMSAADIAVAPYPLMDQALWLSPLKLFEYMATGTAVVASAVGQPAEIVRDGHNGLLVPPGDSTALAATLARLLTDDALRLRLGEQARHDIVQNHSWDQYVAQLERLFGAVMAGQPLPS